MQTKRACPATGPIPGPNSAESVTLRVRAQRSLPVPAAPDYSIVVLSGLGLAVHV